ncbi:2-oxoacid dehydrogenases acyltransferase-domain-containing protein [Mycena rebaudengoi]|nr:2-oxoacid dehydrogenases acyltransferase-domain-containing protein [Mycena rebaudengoi]
MLQGICALSFLREMESRQKEPISPQCTNYSNPPQSTAKTQNRKEMLEWSPITRVTLSQRPIGTPPSAQAPLLHGREGDLLPSPPSVPASSPRRTAPTAPPRPVPSPPSSFHAAPPTALAPPPAAFSPRRTTPIPRAGVPSRRVVHRTPPPYAITGTTTTATSVLVQATYNPSSISYPTTSTSSTAAYPSSAYPSSTYPTSTYPAYAAPLTTTQHHTQQQQRPTLNRRPLPPPPARRLHPLDPAFSGDKMGAAVSDVDMLATPSVRHYARTQGVDLAQIAPGTGRVERADVDAFLAAGTSPSEGSTPSAPRSEKDVLVELGPHAPGDVEGNGEEPRNPPLWLLRHARHHALLPLLNANIPAHYLPSSSNSSTDTSPARFSPAEQSALSLGLPLPTPAVPPTARYTRLTYLPFLKSLARAMMDWPLFRASIAPSPSPSIPSTPKSNSRHLTIRPHADIAPALSTPSGLYTSVLRAVDTRTPNALASQIAELAALGRAVPPALTPKHLAGGATLTVSNVGSAGRGRWASPVLVPGGGIAIVALGRAEWVWDVSGEYPRATGGWAADHRLVEGAEMAAFVESWRGWVEAPGRALGEGV